jgi:NAD(P)-dependent dehydrogenase (short-subunit alcohol dehydrogenase family)
MNESAIPSFLQEIADAFGAIDGVEAVVWCGLAALGNADAFSDFDLYVYTNTPVPVEAREAVIAKRAIARQLNNTFWELEDEWIEAGGSRFNSMYRNCTYAVDEIEERLDRSSALLGYTTAYCFSLANGHILYDARGWLSSVQARLREPFPEQLTRSIIAKNRPVLGGGMQSVYTGTKGAVDAITGVLSRELGPKKIRVNTINPGVVETEGTHSGGVIGSDFEKAAIAQTPLGRVGQPGDIASIAVFLASEESAWLTGEQLLATGGLR